MHDDVNAVSYAFTRYRNRQQIYKMTGVLVIIGQLINLTLKQSMHFFMGICYEIQRVIVLKFYAIYG